jgi:uncharacterized protein YjlB
MSVPLLTAWADSAAPTQTGLWKRMTDEGLNPYSWSNGPYDIYSEHSHPYNKVIYVVQGSITFGLPELGKQLTLEPGDRLDLPAGTLHDAHVGSQGVICLEAHKD